MLEKTNFQKLSGQSTVNLNNFFYLGIIKPFTVLCGLTGGGHNFALSAMNIRRLSQNPQANRQFTRKKQHMFWSNGLLSMWKKFNLPRKRITGGIFMCGNEVLGFIKQRNFMNKFSVSCIPQSAICLLCWFAC
jgi:hypothetical protein